MVGGGLRGIKRGRENRGPHTAERAWSAATPAVLYLGRALLGEPMPSSGAYQLVPGPGSGQYVAFSVLVPSVAASEEVLFCGPCLQQELPG